LQTSDFKRVMESSSKGGHLEFVDITPAVMGNAVILLCRMRTGNAAGQNMSTFAADAVIQHVLDNFPIKPVQYFNGAKGLAMDKTCSAQVHSPYFRRGKRMVVEAEISHHVIQTVLRTTAHKMVECARAFETGRKLGSDVVNDNVMVSNGLAAIFIACGQDPACVLESTGGILSIERTSQGISAHLTLQNIMVGTVGGGTRLPTPDACLDIVLGSNKDIIVPAHEAKAFAEVVGATCLAGELSVIAAMSVHDFSKAHRELRVPQHSAM